MNRRHRAVAKLALDEQSGFDEGDRMRLEPGDLRFGFVEETVASEPAFCRPSRRTAISAGQPRRPRFGGATTTVITQFPAPLGRS
jgi:hypothetical protein